MSKKLFLIGLFFFGVSSCATAVLSPFPKEVGLQLHEDEKRLWSRSEEEQKNLDRSGHIYEDPVLVAYLNDVAQRLIPETVKGKGISFRIKVIKNPLVNAFAFPNGGIYVHTGFLAKMENEAQLATVLAHEITHVTHRHAVQQFRNVSNTAAFVTTLGVIAAQAGRYGNIANILGSIGAMAAVSGYSRALEEEADREGLDLLINAGYDPEESVRLFDRVQRYVEEEKIEEPFFFGSHPRLQERKESYAQLLHNKYAERKGVKAADRFSNLVLLLLLDNALLDLSRGRFSLAKEAIDKVLQREPKNARAHYYLGEVFRQRGEEGDVEKGEAEYLVAAQYDSSYPDPHKALGLIYLKQGKSRKAREAFEQYLFLSPQAQDRPYIEQYLEDLKRKGEGK